MREETLKVPSRIEALSSFPQIWKRWMYIMKRVSTHYHLISGTGVLRLPAGLPQGG